MKTAERIYTIDRASVGLDSYEKARLQLILRQFGVTTYDWEQGEWPESKIEYVTGRLESISDDELAAIDDFVASDLGHIPAPRTSPLKKSWTECPTGVFLSHRWEDAVFVSAVSRQLESLGIGGFVAHKDIGVSAVWRAAIMDGLDTCDAFVAFLHPEFHHSQWCDQEVGWALGRHVPLMVIRPEDLTAPRLDGFIEQLQSKSVDRSNPDLVGFTGEAIYQFLSERPELRSQIAESLVWALERPRSHPHAMSLWRKMVALDYTWPADLLRRVKAAEVSQPFVRNAYTIPSNAYTKLAGYKGSPLESESEVAK